MSLCVVVNGTAGAGKDSFVDYAMEYLQEQGLTCSKYSSVDQVKAAAMLLGWDGVKDEKGRQFLSDLKDASTRAYDGPMNYMLGLIELVAHDVMFFHVREPAEIEKFLHRVPGSIAVLIERPGVTQYSNHADINVDRFDYQYTIRNVGTLEQLSFQAYIFAAKLVRAAR